MTEKIWDVPIKEIPDGVIRHVGTIDSKKLEDGYKADETKLRTDLISPQALLGMVAVLTFGANKYEDRNWEKGMAYSRPYAAALRHLLAWWTGEDNDPETGLSHLDHAACCIHFLSHYVKNPIRYTSRDNRP